VKLFHVYLIIVDFLKKSYISYYISFSFSLFICHKGYKKEKEKKVLLFTLSWRGSPKEASRLIENGLPQINK